jgi:hypothetical protein
MSVSPLFLQSCHLGNTDFTFTKLVIYEVKDVSKPAIITMLVLREVTEDHLALKSPGIRVILEI